MFQLERRSKAQIVGNAHGYLADQFNFRITSGSKICHDLKMSVI